MRCLIFAQGHRVRLKQCCDRDEAQRRIYAAAFGKAPKFYAFWRTLQAYRVSLEHGTTLVLSPDHEFFEFLAPSHEENPLGRLPNLP